MNPELAYRRLRFAVQGCFNGIWGDEPNGTDDVVVVRVADFDRELGKVVLGETPTLRAVAPSARNNRLLQPGDLLIEKSGGGDSQPVGNVVLYESGPEAVCSNFVARMPTAENCDSRYVAYAFRSLYEAGKNIPHIKQTSGIQNLDSDSYLNERAWLPEKHVQQKIADELDERVGRINQLVREKLRLHRLLDVWAQSSLEYLCFGLDSPAVPTGNPWVPALPMGWRVLRLKHLVTGIEQGWSPECEARLALPEEWGVLKAGASNRGVYNDAEHKALPLGVSPIPDLEVRVGDVLVSRASGSAELVGSVAYVFGTRPLLMLSDKNFRLKFGSDPEMLPELVAWTCNAPSVRQQIRNYVSGAEGLAKNIGSGDLREVYLPVPPKAQQAAIAAKARAIRKSRDQLQANLLEHVELLGSYKASIISQALRPDRATPTSSK